MDFINIYGVPLLLSTAGALGGYHGTRFFLAPKKDSKYEQDGFVSLPILIFGLVVGLGGVVLVYPNLGLEGSVAFSTTVGVIMGKFDDSLHYV